MHDPDRPDDRMPEMAPGELGFLLREIEREAVPERLLELARRLQAALADERRRREKNEERPART